MCAVPGIIMLMHYSHDDYLHNNNWGEPERAPHSRDLHHFFMYVCLSVNPIAYNRISTWKTGILRARACRILHDCIYLRGKYCAAHLRVPSIRPAYAGLRANCASGLDTPCSVHERCPSIYAG